VRPVPSKSERSELFTARVVWVIAGVGLVVIGMMAWLGFTRSFGATALSLMAGIGYVVSLACFLVSGAMILSRQPRNVIGWLLLIPGLAAPITELGNIWLGSLDPAPVTTDPWLWLLLWLTSWSWVLLIFPVFHLLLTLPSGTLLSRRWRWVVWLEGAMVVTMMSLSAFGSRFELLIDEEIVWAVPNPIGLTFLNSEFFAEGAAFESVWTVALLVVTVTCVAGFVLRFRRGSSDEREQLKWPLFAVALFGLVYGTAAAGTGIAPGGLADLLFGLSLAGIPVAIAIAVLRYRLYEIDRIISRTVSYTVVVALLAGVFFGVVALVSSFLPTESSDLAIAGSTLAVAALFNPLRSRIQKVVDRRFNRSHYDAQRVIQGFAGSLQGRADSEGIVEGWVGVVSETMQPSMVAIWVREGK